MNERRTLEEIDRRLTASDPRLAARLGTLSGERLGPAAVRGALWRHRGAVVCWSTVTLALVLLLLAAALHTLTLTAVGLALLVTIALPFAVRQLRGRTHAGSPTHHG